MNCPKCRKKVLVIMRHFTPSRWKTVRLEIHHHEDAERFALGAAVRICRIRVTWEKSQRLMVKLARKKEVTCSRRASKR